jgi:hypothetical protein
MVELALYSLCAGDHQSTPPHYYDSSRVLIDTRQGGSAIACLLVLYQANMKHDISAASDSRGTNSRCSQRKMNLTE